MVDPIHHYHDPWSIFLGSSNIWGSEVVQQSSWELIWMVYIPIWNSEIAQCPRPVFLDTWNVISSHSSNTAPLLIYKWRIAGTILVPSSLPPAIMSSPQQTSVQPRASTEMCESWSNTRCIVHWTQHPFQQPWWILRPLERVMTRDSNVNINMALPVSEVEGRVRWGKTVPRDWTKLWPSGYPGLFPNYARLFPLLRWATRIVPRRNQSH